MKMDSASSRILNVNVGILGHIDSGKTSLGISPLRISTSSFSSQLLIASAQLILHSPRSFDTFFHGLLR